MLELVSAKWKGIKTWPGRDDAGDTEFQVGDRPTTAADGYAVVRPELEA